MDPFFGVAGFVVASLGVVMALLIWPRSEPPEPVRRRARDTIDGECDDLVRSLKSGRDYCGSRVVVQAEMPGLWTVWLDGHVHERTARTPEQARIIAETHLRLVSEPPRRHGGHAVGNPRHRRGGAIRPDWRRDLAP